jgi:hypothetical protein
MKLTGPEGEDLDILLFFKEICVQGAFVAPYWGG